MMQSVGAAVTAYDVGQDDLEEDKEEGGSSSGEEIVGGGAPNGQGRREAPAPVLAPKGLAGLLEGRRPGTVETLDTATLSERHVLLNVYDVGDSDILQKINKTTTANNCVLIGGIFHAGVELYGQEFGYGFTEDDRTGIGVCGPRLHPQHTYRATVPMGETALSREQLCVLITRLAREWRGSDYHLVHKNCVSFCSALVKELGLGRIPGWVDRLARHASRLDKTVQMLRSIRAEDVQGQASEVLEKIKRDSAQAIDGIARGVPPRAALPPHLEVEQVQAKALQIGEKAQERVQALGASLLQWGSELRTTVEREAPEPVAAIGQTVQGHMQTLQAGLQTFGQDLQKTVLWAVDGEPEANPRKKAQRSKRRGGRGAQAESSEEQVADNGAEGTSWASDLGIYSEPPRSDPRGTSGLIRKQEDNLALMGLLADDAEDEDHPAARAPPPAQPARRAAAPRRVVEEAPAEWSSQPAAAAAPEAACAAAAPAMDLLGGEAAPRGSVGLSAAPPAMDLLGGEADPLDCVHLSAAASAAAPAGNAGAVDLLTGEPSCQPQAPQVPAKAQAGQLPAEGHRPEQPAWVAIDLLG